MDCLGSLWCNSCNKLCFCVYKAGNGHGMWFRKEEPMLDEWVATLFWDCKNSPSMYEMDHKRPCVLASKLFEVNGLSCVGINKLMYKLDVLT